MSVKSVLSSVPLTREIPKNTLAGRMGHRTIAVQVSEPRSSRLAARIPTLAPRPTPSTCEGILREIGRTTFQYKHPPAPDEAIDWRKKNRSRS